MARKYTFEDSAVVSDLKYWGYHKGKQYAADGYSPQSTLVSLLSGVGGPGGHRILIPDMPHEAWEINGRVMQLPSHLVAVLVGRYCLPRYSAADDPAIASALGYSTATFYRRLRQAKLAYKRSVFGLTLSELTAVAMVSCNYPP